MIEIDYFFSTLSPYCYLAGDRFETIAKRHSAKVKYKPFDILNIYARTGGVLPGDRHQSRKDYRTQDLMRLAKKSGLGFNLTPRHWPTNAAPSSYAIIAAQQNGSGDVGALVQRLLTVSWVEERDIAVDDVIKECLTDAGFDPTIADSGLMLGADIYGRNTEEALMRGVFGAPSYLVGDQVFWGQDRLSFLDDYLGENT